MCVLEFIRYIFILILVQTPLIYANQCASVFNKQNPPSTILNIETITDQLVEFYFQSVVGKNDHNMSIQGKEIASNQISIKVNHGQPISAQNKLMTELNELQKLYDESAVNLYYQKIKQCLSQFRQFQKEYEKKK